MKLSKRILACTASLAVATTMLTATYASADSEVTAKNFSEAPEFRKNGIDLSMDEVYSTSTVLPDKPTVGISFQMGQTYYYRGGFSDKDVTENSSVYVDGEKLTFTYTLSPWAHFYVHAAQVNKTSDGKKLTTKRGADTTIGVAQPGGAPNIYMDANGNVVDVPDTNNIPEGAIQYFQESELKDAVITGNGTFKAAIVNHDFASDMNDKPGFNMLYLSSNIGYFDGKVSDKAYTVDASELSTAVAEAEAFLPTLKAELEELKKLAEEPATQEPTAEPATEDSTEEVTEDLTEEVTEAAPEEATESEVSIDEQIATLENNIAALEAAIASGKEAAANDGAALASDYSLKISSMNVNCYDTKDSYDLGTPDRVVPVKGFATRSPLNTTNGSTTYNFSEYNIVDTYSDKGFTSYGNGIGSVTTENGLTTGYMTGDSSVLLSDGQLDGIGGLVSLSDAGCTMQLPKYALEVEFTVDDAEVFGMQAAIDSSLESVSTAMREAGGLVWSALDSAIADAEAINKDEYTTTSYDALMAAVEAGKALKAKADNGEEVTQEEIDAATEAIRNALAALEPIAVGGQTNTPGGTDGGNSNNPQTTNGGSNNGSGNGNSSTDANPGTGAGVAVTASMAVLVAAGFVISRKRK